MKNPLKGSGARKGGLHTQSRQHHITKSGNKIKLNQNMVGRIKAKRDARLQKKAAYLATLPKGRLQRTIHRMHPRRVAKYWFSREGGIMALKVAGIGALATFLFLIGVFAYFRKDLPNLRDISGNNIGGSIRYYDRSGQTLLWEDYDAVKRNPVGKDAQAQVIKDATVAIEDKDFFNHGGFDLRGITRAGVNNALGKGGTQGGSTITQQLVKLTQNWSKDQTYTRKVKELILAVELERTYSKHEILAGYLDTAPYGDITYGVEAAMRDYFQKSAKEITLDEAAFLAAIPKSPTFYSPYGARYNKEALIGRQHYVLDLMTEQGKITSQQRDEAKKVDTLAKIKPRQPKYEGIKAPYFVLTAKEKLTQMRGANAVALGGLKVITTLDLDKQRIAEEEVTKGMAQVRRQGGDTAAFVAEDVKTGQVVALVGGTDFSNQTYGQNNYARLKLPPGSSFKPYDYLSVIEHTDQFGAGTVLYDVQEPIDGYPCTNKARPQSGGNCLYDYDFRYPGPVTLRYALGGSRNVPAVKAMLIAGVDKTIGTAEKLGLKDTGDERIEGQGYKCYEPGDETLSKETQCYGSSAIGDGAFLKLDEHVHAFSTISRNGKLIPQTFILKVEDARGETIEEWKPKDGKQVVRDESAYIVADMLEDPNASYFGRKPHRYNGHKFALKTGTTNDSKDGWMMGFSTQYSAGVWVGYHNRQKELSGFMEVMTEPIWGGWMRRVHKDLKPEERARPQALKTQPAFVVRSHVGVGSVEPSPANDLFPSWYKTKARNNGKEIIDKVSNKLATDCTPELARQEAGNANANQFSADRFHGGGGTANTTEKDDVHKCEDAKPNVTLTISGAGSSYVFTATASQGTHPISSDRFPGTINFKVDGQVVNSQQVGSSPATVSFTHNFSTAGSHNVTAEIIDSVLYSNSESQTIETTGSTPANAFSLTGIKQSAVKVTFNWAGANGLVKVYRSDGQLLCQDAGNSCTYNGPLMATSSSVYATDANGSRADATTSGP
jgi:membrane peptidoglycan carboxypeptidase